MSNTTQKIFPEILLTGVTGYIGGRLLRQLEQKGLPLKVLARRPERLDGRLAASTQICKGDVLDYYSLCQALDGVKTAYYLVHSMGSAGSFEDQDRDGAANFGRAASQAGVEKIIYLGGLADSSENLSAHLRSRVETGQMLSASGVPVTEFRASIVIGSGSLSFEMVRALTERLPIMITPRWVRTPAQPIAIGDLLDYLIEALDYSPTGHEIFEIGGADVVSYEDLMREYARQRKLKRTFISVPVLTPQLSSLWLALVTPLFAKIGRKLIESVRHATVVTNTRAQEVFQVKPRGVADAIAGALSNEDQEFAETRWSDALSSSGGIRDWGGVRFGSRLVDSRSVTVAVPPEAAFRPIACIGGSTGYYYGNFLWKLRGALDLASGGIGYRRGRRHPSELRVGDTLDFWRVDSLVPNRKLRLSAEMRVPGRAWLEFEVEPVGAGSKITQTALFDPLGLFGLLYWYCLWPVHQFVFAGMLQGIARAACQKEVVIEPERA